VRKTADQVVAPVLPYEPVFPHAGIIPKNPVTVSTTLYQYALTPSASPTLSLRDPNYFNWKQRKQLLETTSF